MNFWSTTSKMSQRIQERIRSTGESIDVRVTNGLKRQTGENMVVVTDEIGVTSLRFLMLLIFALDTIGANLTFSMYPIIGDVMAIYYEVEQSSVAWASMLLSLSFAVAFLPSVYMFQRVGLRIGLCTGSIGVAAGFWILCGSFSRDRFWVVLIGQVVVGASQVCFFTVSAKMASVWFGSGEVSRACAVGVFSNMVGLGLSCVIPPLVVTSRNPEEVQKQLSTLNYSLAAFASMTALFTFLVFKERPLKPPSQSQAILRSRADSRPDEEESTLKQLRTVFRNKNYLLQMVSSGLVFTIGNTFATCINGIVLAKYPTANKDVGIMGLLSVLCGIPAGLMHGIILDKTHKYKELAIVVCLGSALSLALFAGSLYVGLELAYFSTVCIGFFMAGYPTVGFELAAEVSYPSTEIISAGCMNCFGNIISIGVIYLSTWMIEGVGILPNNVVYVGIVTLALICACFVKSDLRRLAANKSPNPITVVQVQSGLGFDNLAANYNDEKGLAIRYPDIQPQKILK